MYELQVVDNRSILIFIGQLSVRKRPVKSIFIGNFLLSRNHFRSGLWLFQYRPYHILLKSRQRWNVSCLDFKRFLRVLDLPYSLYLTGLNRRIHRCRLKDRGFCFRKIVSAWQLYCIYFRSRWMLSYSHIPLCLDLRLLNGRIKFHWGSCDQPSVAFCIAQRRTHWCGTNCFTNCLRAIFDGAGLRKLNLFVGLFEIFLIFRLCGTATHWSPRLREKIGRSDSWATALTASAMSHQNLWLTFGTRQHQVWVFLKNLAFFRTRPNIIFVLRKNLHGRLRLGLLFWLWLCLSIEWINSTGVSHKFRVKIVDARHCLHRCLAKVGM